MYKRQSSTGSTGDSSTGSTGDSPTGSTGDSSTGSTETCTRTPEETAGPYPGDGSNGANALALTGIVRSDIRSSIAGAEGVPLTITLRLVDETCAPLPGRAIYLWQCDRDADYSMYTGAAVDENYLRGVQETDANGEVSFRSIFPACYPGRWPHAHFEVYPGLGAIGDAANRLMTSQLALPGAACDAAFTAPGYGTSVANLAALELESDSVFSDGVTLQLAEVTGSVDDGFTATLTLTIQR